MKWGYIIAMSFVLASVQALSGCASMDSMEKDGMIPERKAYTPTEYSEDSYSNDSSKDMMPATPNYSSAPSPEVAATAAPSAQRVIHSVGDSPEDHMMRHTLREIVEYDVSKMFRLLHKELDLKESDEEAFYNQAAAVLGQTVMLQTHYTERDAATREFKSRIDNEDYIVIVDRAADQLIHISQSSPFASDQVGAVVALTNLVLEIKSSKRPELKSTLQKIANAKLNVSTEAKKYARDSMEKLPSPVAEAKNALALN